jgi:hypothetical protein
MDFLVEGLTQAERASRKRWKKRLSKTYTRCIVEHCRASLINTCGHLRGTDDYVKAVCSDCIRTHRKWYRWFIGEGIYFKDSDGFLYRRKVDFNGVESLDSQSVVGLLRLPLTRREDVMHDFVPSSLKGTRAVVDASATSKMLDGSPVPTGVRGPDLVVELERPEGIRLPIGLKKPSKAEVARMIAERKDFLPTPRVRKIDPLATSA